MQTPDPQQTTPGQAPVSDDWTRLSQPPKARISDAYAMGDPKWRRIVAVLAVIGAAGIAWAMLSYAARVPANQRPPAEPTRSEQRARDAAELLRQRGIETQPFQRSQEERARRRLEKAP